MAKVAVIVLEGTELKESVAKMRHAKIYSKEIKAEGNEIILIFDGNGTKWLDIISNDTSDFDFLNKLFREIQSMGIIYRACDFCSTRKEVKDSLVKKNIELVSEYDGHPNVGRLINEGYQVIVI
ncbi:MAG: hypothetical protein EVJ47_08905 [Candidatus Acidulodesulfobacterium ferriphilum]|uniref:DsrE family protein n=1 Tax=Candidatus Acidulodesulfobacterium ferriphilum TaxID=2597223 RepID=A0A519B914_9DELT|nr:MAG: hypothetical protein EVJ47_08905 [Candidatus Acidulodesulfobacterium ferriphilum]